MLRDLNELKGYVLLAEDGEIGRCRYFLFDDHYWTVRYMVADTGKWLPDRKVLISPISLGSPDGKTRRLPVKLTKNSIENSPPISADQPVSREYEKEWFKHYGWSVYWIGGGIWGPVGYPPEIYQAPTEKQTVQEETEPLESHLRSTDEVEGYSIHSLDGDIGQVDNFIIEDSTWTIRYMVVKTGNWLSGEKVLISPEWIELVDWADAKVTVDLTREEIENSPPYDPATPVNRDYELKLYDYYGRPKYW